MPPYCAVDSSLLCKTIGKFYTHFKKASPVKIMKGSFTLVNYDNLQRYYP